MRILEPLNVQEFLTHPDAVVRRRELLHFVQWYEHQRKRNRWRYQLVRAFQRFVLRRKHILVNQPVDALTWAVARAAVGQRAIAEHSVNKEQPA